MQQSYRNNYWCSITLVRCDHEAVKGRWISSSNQFFKNNRWNLQKWKQFGDIYLIEHRITALNFKQVHSERCGSISNATSSTNSYKHFISPWNLVNSGFPFVNRKLYRRKILYHKVTLEHEMYWKPGSGGQSFLARLKPILDSHINNADIQNANLTAS